MNISVNKTRGCVHSNRARRHIRLWILMDTKQSEVLLPHALQLRLHGTAVNPSTGPPA